MHRALPLPSADDGQEPRSVLTGLVAHLDIVFALALTLTGESDAAASLTERVFAGVPDDLWATLGGHGLRDRLLARCVSLFAEPLASHAEDARVAPVIRAERQAGGLAAVLRSLPWKERAAIALVDQLDLRYASGAAVLGTDVAEFRTLLRRARGVLFAAHRAGAC